MDEEKKETTAFEKFCMVVVISMIVLFLFHPLMNAVVLAILYPIYLLFCRMYSYPRPVDNYKAIVRAIIYVYIFLLLSALGLIHVGIVGLLLGMFFDCIINITTRR